MTDINNVNVIGRLTRDAELTYTPNGTALCKFSIAVNWSKKNGDTWVDEVNFFNIILWGRQGEVLHQYLLKGKQVGISGELRQERWQQDGQNRSKIEIVAHSVQLLSGNSNNGSSDGGGSRSGHDNGSSRSNGGRSGGGTQYRTQENDDGFTDEIPF